MVSSVVRVCLFIACCGVLIIDCAESTWNHNNEEIVFTPYRNEKSAPRDSIVLLKEKLDNGIQIFTPPASKRGSATNDDVVQNWKHDDEGQLVFIPPNTNKGSANHIHFNNKPLSEGTILFNPGETSASQNMIKSRAIRNGESKETSRWYPRALEMNLPFHYYY